MSYRDFDWITNRLAVGGLVGESDELPFDSVLSMETYAPLAIRQLVTSPTIDYRWCSILDGVSSERHDRIVACFDTAAAQLARWIGDGRRALVHCYMGSSRAATSAIWYLVRYQDLSWDEALALVRSRRPVTDPNIRFEIPLRLAAGERLSPAWLRRRLVAYCEARHDPSDVETKIREIGDDLRTQGTMDVLTRVTP